MNSDKIFEEKLKKIQNLEFEPSQIADIQKALDHTADISKKVDNIDVTGCEFLTCDCYDDKRLCAISNPFERTKGKHQYKLCRDNPNCYCRNWKRSEQQLQQKERECERLEGELIDQHIPFAKIIDTVFEVIGEKLPDSGKNGVSQEKVSKALKQLQAHNARMRKGLERILEQDACSRCDGVGIDLDCCDKSCGAYIAKQTLEDINNDK